MISWPSQTLWLDTPKGEATVLFVHDRGPESDLEWTCVHGGGEIWTWLNADVRVAKNRTLGRDKQPSPPEATGITIIGKCTHGAPIDAVCWQCLAPKPFKREQFVKVPV